MFRRRRIGFRTHAPSQVTLLISFVLWIIGVASLIFGVKGLPRDYAVWALVIAGLLLILGSVVEGL